MLTEIKAYSSWQSAPTLLLSEFGRAETDLIQIRNVEGLDPVQASVNTSPFGSIDGVAFTGANVLSRNIVITVHPNPDWLDWSFESLRRLLYSYFMPKRPVQLVFNSDDMPSVQISGIVESVSANPFSADPEFIISVICPDPYFTAVEPEVISGETCLATDIIMEDIDYNGTVEAGIYAKVTFDNDPSPTAIAIQIGNPALSYFEVLTTVSIDEYFEMNSIPGNKFVQNVNTDSGIITNLLSKATIREGSSWPNLQPGENNFCVITDVGMQIWELTYFERFGGL